MIRHRLGVFLFLADSFSMKFNKKIFRFEGPLIQGEAKFAGLHVEFPGDVEKLFGTKSSVRMHGSINGIAVKRALIPGGNGAHYVVIPGELRRKMGLRAGETVKIELQQSPDPDELDIPEELLAVLEMEPDVHAHFDRQTLSMRRGICYWINSAKREETRIKRALEVLKRFQSGTGMFGDTKLKP